MSDLILRSATAADIPALSRLGTDSFVAKFGSMYRAEDLAAFLTQSYSQTVIAAELANPDRLYRLAERDGKLLAYCKLGLSCSFPQFARGSKVLELKQLYALSEATGIGIGGALMDWAMAEFASREADEVQISVFSGNLDAQRFYRRYGFEKVADVTFKVGAQLDAEFLFARILPLHGTSL
jgi:diamine N-acetyltransferase